MTTQETIFQPRIDADTCEAAAHILKAVAHPARLAVIDLLAQNGRMHCSQIMGILGIEQTLLSHHMATLFDRGILDRDKEGKFIYYRLADPRAAKVIDCIIGSL